jgi:hypothetical protein
MREGVPSDEGRAQLSIYLEEVRWPSIYLSVQPVAYCLQLPSHLAHALMG